MNNIKYQIYLRSEFWQTKRNKAFKRSSGRCQVCNSKDRLEVHHRTYERLGNENKRDLTLLCNECHTKFHSTKKQILEREIKKLNDDLTFALEIAKKMSQLRDPGEPKLTEDKYIVESKEKLKLLSEKLKELECQETE